MQIKEINNFGEKENYPFQMRLTKSQKERLQLLAEQNGFKTISAFVKFQIFNPSLEMKVNQILSILKEQGGENGKTE
jgi:hypothetical protein